MVLIEDVQFYIGPKDTVTMSMLKSHVNKTRRKTNQYPASTSLYYNAQITEGIDGQGTGPSFGGQTSPSRLASGLDKLVDSATSMHKQGRGITVSLYVGTTPNEIDTDQMLDRSLTAKPLLNQ